MDFFEFTHNTANIDSCNLAPTSGYSGTTSSANMAQVQFLQEELTGVSALPQPFDGAGTYHVYTVQINTDGSFLVWVDGVYLWTVTGATATDWMCVMFNYAIAPGPPGSGWTGDSMEVDYFMAWQDAGVAAGSGIIGGGIAPGTTIGNSVAPDFVDNFTAFNSSNWYPCYPYSLTGEADEGSHASWNAGTTAINGSVVNPFSVVSDVTATDGYCLRITCRQASGAEQTSLVALGATTAESLYIGGIMVSQAGWTGGYVEWRAKLDGNGNGMWPALWLYAQTQSGTSNGWTQTKAATAQAGCEIDMLEVFGGSTGEPWNSTVHYGPVGATTQQGPYSQTTDTSGWHTYGIWWNGSTVLQFYQDRVLVHDASAYASQFSGVQMCARMNYTVETGASGTSMYMDIDSFSHYPSRPF
jgi:hypothetical protein